jgi:hypothetical protein
LSSVQTNSRLVLGPEWRLDLALRRSEDGTRPNTSFVERQNLFERRSCCYLHRRTPDPARNVQRLCDALEILRVYYNYIRPHASLSIHRPPRTPAMAAEILDRQLSFRTIMSWVPRPMGKTPLRNPPERTTLTRKARGCAPLLNSQRKGSPPASPAVSGKRSWGGAAAGAKEEGFDGWVLEWSEGGQRAICQAELGNTACTGDA